MVLFPAEGFPTSPMRGSRGMVGWLEEQQRLRGTRGGPRGRALQGTGVVGRTRDIGLSDADGVRCRGQRMDAVSNSILSQNFEFGVDEAEGQPRLMQALYATYREVQRAGAFRDLHCRPTSWAAGAIG